MRTLRSNALILGSLFDYLSDKTLLWVFSPVPTILLPLIDLLWNQNNKATITFVTWLIAAIYYSIVLIGALPLLRRMNKLENEQLGHEAPAPDVA